MIPIPTPPAFMLGDILLLQPQAHAQTPMGGDAPAPASSAIVAASVQPATQRGARDAGALMILGRQYFDLYTTMRPSLAVDDKIGSFPGGLQLGYPLSWRGEYSAGTYAQGDVVSVNTNGVVAFYRSTAAANTDTPPSARWVAGDTLSVVSTPNDQSGGAGVLYYTFAESVTN